jgi:effector-binding domain-containing protein
MTPQPEIRELAAQSAAIERAVTDAEGMGAAIDRAFGALFARLGKLEVTPADAPFVRYLKTGEELEIELGVPVKDGVMPLDGLDEASLPAGRVAVLRHTGPYEDLRAACRRLRGWVSEQGESASGPHWESYVTDPAAEPDPARRITDIYLPLR